MPGPLEVDDDVTGVGGADGVLQTESTYHVLCHTCSAASVTFVYRNTRKHTALFLQADVIKERMMWCGRNLECRHFIHFIIQMHPFHLLLLGTNEFKCC